MRELTLFCEDSFHEKFVGSLLSRFALDYGVDIAPRFLSAQGGLPRMHFEFRQFLKDLSKQRARLPDSIIVVVDANCKGHNERKKEMQSVLAHYPDQAAEARFGKPGSRRRWVARNSPRISCRI